MKFIDDQDQCCWCTMYEEPVVVVGGGCGCVRDTSPKINYM